MNKVPCKENMPDWVREAVEKLVEAKEITAEDAKLVPAGKAGLDVMAKILKRAYVDKIMAQVNDDMALR